MRISARAIDLGFGQQAPSPPHRNVFASGMIRPPLVGDVGTQETVVGESPNGVSYLQFTLSNEAAAAASVWPLLVLPTRKPQGSACHMTKLGQGYLARDVVNRVACFLWPERGTLPSAQYHRSVTVKWAESIAVTWVLSLGTRRQGPAVFDDEYPHCAGLWLHTNKDTVKLCDAADLSHNTTHNVQIALDQPIDEPCSRGRRWVAVWLDGRLCLPHYWDKTQSLYAKDTSAPRVQSVGAWLNLERGGRLASVIVTWEGDRGEVSDICIYAGHLHRDLH